MVDRLASKADCTFASEIKIIAIGVIWNSLHRYSDSIAGLIYRPRVQLE